MVKGIGTDIVAIQRLADCIAKHGDRFLKKVFTGPEIDQSRSKANPAVHFAGQWAAKEAFFKALPPSCQPVAGWKDVEVLASDDSGRPEIAVCSRLLQDKLSGEGISCCRISISHDADYAMAFVLLE
jgi:holo-[acyl-carrier protein] synthase